MSAVRTTVLWVPDWPVLAAAEATDTALHLPAVVFAAGRGVIAASAAARSAGVRPGMRRRAAQQACPEVILLPSDEARDTARFEPVVQAAETVVAGLEVARPGLLLLPTGQAVRFHGSEEELSRLLVEAVAEAGYAAQVGIADGLLAAILAAREDPFTAPSLSVGGIVPAGASSPYLQPRRVSELLHATTDLGVAAKLRGLIGLWARLGIRTLGELAALPEDAVSSRFGDLGIWAGRLARGQDLRPVAKRRPEQDLHVEAVFEHPIARVDMATFAARPLAEQLQDLLTAQGMGCGRLRIAAVTEDYDGNQASLERVWRTDDAALGGLSAARILDRVRWQLEGWLGDKSREPAPLIRLALTAEEVAPAGTHQPSLWGANAGGDERAKRSLLRVQGLLGGDAVLTCALQGGRDPRSRVHLVPFGQEDHAPRAVAQPWPGALPAPAPATVLPEPEPVSLLDERGRTVLVNERLVFSAPPVRLLLPALAAESHDDEPEWSGSVGIASFAGPWPLDERWWEPAAPEGDDAASRRRKVLLQVSGPDGSGYLLAQSQGQWHLEGIYD